MLPQISKRTPATLTAASARIASCKYLARKTYYSEEDVLTFLLQPYQGLQK